MIIISRNFQENWDNLYPRLNSNMLDGLSVTKDIPNMSSISASIENPSILEGVREVSMGNIPLTDAKDLFYAADDMAKVRNLASQIKSNRMIKPLIVVHDHEGAYILEGAHRLAALKMLGFKSFPALVVVDEPEPAQQA